MRALVFAIAACGGAPKLPPAIAKQPFARTVTYQWHSDIREPDLVRRDPSIPPQPPGCTRLVLVETIVRADGNRALEIEATIKDGDMPACGVGMTVHLYAPTGADGETRLVAPGLDGRTFDRVRQLHGKLGRTDDGFMLRLSPLPWGHPFKRVAIAGVDYYELESDGSQQWDQHITYGHSMRGTKMRVRASDHAVACASFSLSSSGGGEWGGWSQSEHEWLAVDYGDGDPKCPPP